MSAYVATTANIGAMSPKETYVSSEPTKKLSLVDDREDNAPGLEIASDGSTDSLDAGRDESSAGADKPRFTRVQSAENLSFSKSVTENDLRFSKQLDEQGEKELLMFLQAPSSVILEAILAYEPQEAFGFVKTHVHDGLSDDENPEFDADDHTIAIYGRKAVRIAAPAAGAAAVATRSAPVAPVDPQRQQMSAAARHFTPEPKDNKKAAVAGAAAGAGTAAVVASNRSEPKPTQVTTTTTTTTQVAPEPKDNTKAKAAAVATGTAAGAALASSQRKQELDAQKAAEIEAQRAAMPVATRHFTPDPRDQKEQVYEPYEMPAAMKHFTPDWEVDLPPTVRESLDKMEPEERAKWVARPIAVQHFTSFSDDYQQKKEAELTPYEMPIAMKHFAPKPKEKKEYTPDPVPAAVQHFTPDWEAEAEKKRQANAVKAPMPAAVKHFTPEWEVFIPPTIRESLASMSPEERKRWANTPMAVSHFTPYTPPPEAYVPPPMPAAQKHFTPDPTTVTKAKPAELDYASMPAATRHFTQGPDANKQPAAAAPAPVAPAAAKSKSTSSITVPPTPAAKKTPANGGTRQMSAAARHFNK